MAHGNIKLKRVIIFFSFLIIFLLVALLIYKMSSNRKEVSFDENDKIYFKMFANKYEPEEYKFYSLDAYYLEDTGKYYYNSKYSLYIDVEDRWSEIDKVYYGDYADFENFYCLNWPSLSEYEDENKEFERAKREGIHKTYTTEEIEEFFQKAYDEKEY